MTDEYKEREAYHKWLYEKLKREHERRLEAEASSLLHHAEVFCELNDNKPVRYCEEVEKLKELFEQG